VSVLLRQAGHFEHLSFRSSLGSSSPRGPKRSFGGSSTGSSHLPIPPRGAVRSLSSSTSALRKLKAGGSSLDTFHVLCDIAGAVLRRLQEAA
jgi:hypothetical protein